MANQKILKINKKDNVSIALNFLNKGEILSFENQDIMLLDNIEIGHKISMKNIMLGEHIIKYGQSIGIAYRDIPCGSLVHVHNLKTNLDSKIDYGYKPVTYNYRFEQGIPEFYGFKRKNGKVGIRNEIWIINTVGCVNTSAEKIAAICNDKFKSENFDGVFSFSHPYGCSQLGVDLNNTRKVLSGLIRNPNAGGILLLGLGCENIQISDLLKDFEDTGIDRLRSFNAQDVDNEIDEGVKLITELYNILKNDKREKFPVSYLTIGMKCGGSDGFSGISANPLIGKITDIITSVGGKVILTEVPEMFGAEQDLLNRAKDRFTFDRIVNLIDDFKKYFHEYNQPIYKNPSPGNKDGGITTLEEKSYGAIQKGGNAIITQVLNYGEQIEEKGLALLQAPGNDGISSTAMVVSGASLLLFTTGRGTPLGCPVPTVKISSNSSLFNKKSNWIDFDAGPIIDSSHDLDSLAINLLDFILQVSSGKLKTKNEINGNKEIAIWKTGVTL